MPGGRGVGVADAGVAGDLKAVSTQNDILNQIVQANAMLPQLATTARLYGVSRTETNYEEWEKEEVKFEGKLNEIGRSTNDSGTQRERIASMLNILHEKVRVTNRLTDRETLEQVWGIKEGISQMRPIADLLLKMGNEDAAALGQQRLCAEGSGRHFGPLGCRA